MKWNCCGRNCKNRSMKSTNLNRWLKNCQPRIVSWNLATIRRSAVEHSTCHCKWNIVFYIIRSYYFANVLLISAADALTSKPTAIISTRITHTSQPPMKRWPRLANDQWACTNNARGHTWTKCNKYLSHVQQIACIKWSMANMARRWVATRPHRHLTAAPGRIYRCHASTTSKCAQTLWRDAFRICGMLCRTSRPRRCSYHVPNVFVQQSPIWRLSSQR